MLRKHDDTLDGSQQALQPLTPLLQMQTTIEQHCCCLCYSVAAAAAVVYTRLSRWKLHNFALHAALADLQPLALLHTQCPASLVGTCTVHRARLLLLLLFMLLHTTSHTAAALLHNWCAASPVSVHALLRAPLLLLLLLLLLGRTPCHTALQYLPVCVHALLRAELRAVSLLA